MEETPTENTTGSGCETEHDKKNNENGNDEKIDDEEDEHCDNDNKNDVNSAENSFLFTKVDSSNDSLTKQFKNPFLNADV